jgi:hypothetical protein
MQGLGGRDDEPAVNDVLDSLRFACSVIVL